jgi:hypothetical protein
VVAAPGEVVLDVGVKVAECEVKVAELLEAAVMAAR